MFKRVRLNKRELHLLILCCIIIVGAVAYFLVIEPVMRHYVSVKEEIEGKEAQFLKLQRMLSLKKPIEDTYLELLPKLSQNASDEERFAYFLKEVELNSRQKGLYITSLKPISIVEKDNYKEYLISVEAEAELSALAKFLYNLAQSSQLITIEELQINYLSGEENTLQFKITLSRMIINTKNAK